MILDNISFTINPGESILLVGENGAGKSTLLMLLNSFYDNYKGKILIDDVELHSIAQKSIWESISMMFQGGTLLPLTLKENICFDKDFPSSILRMTRSASGVSFMGMCLLLYFHKFEKTNSPLVSTHRDRVLTNGAIIAQDKRYCKGIL